ncbi:MAG TPA: hypothetical protein PLU94_02090 [Methanoregulaceae archaeon]|nr:hypothetical protein [Methanoregulaceae archaeon]HPM60971.1 hypothetical protein [Methanoregulaceae archaeon]
MNLTDSGTVTYTLDIAAILSAIIWPIVVIAILVFYRKEIPTVFKWLKSHVKKFEFQGISIELAEANGYSLDWSATEHDLRSQATFTDVGSSSEMPHFLSQITEGGKTEYAIVNLSNGKKWLSSRIFIMTILYTQMKGIEGIVFLEKTDYVRKKFLGWAEPITIIKAFGKRYTWFEKEYISAYSEIFSGFITTSDNELPKTQKDKERIQGYFTINRDGDLFFEHFTPEVRINIMIKFLNSIQKKRSEIPSDKLYEWVRIDSNPEETDQDIHEHSRFIDADKLEEILGNGLFRPAVSEHDLDSMNVRERVRKILSYPYRFVAVTSENGRFEYLVDRNKLIEQLVKNEVANTDLE